MMKSLRFSETCIVWIERILATGSSSILLNGVPGSHFHCCRGVRQGDPCLPFSLCLLRICFSALSTKLISKAFLSCPFPTDELDQFPIVQYAGNTIIIMRALQRELFTPSSLVESFSVYWFKNQKSCLVSLDISLANAQLLAGVFGCKI